MQVAEARLKKDAVRRAVAALVIMACCTGPALSQNHGDDALITFTRAQLGAAEEQTRHGATRMDGLHTLIRMSGTRMYEGSVIGGDPDAERFAMRGEAAKAAWSCRDVATVGKALDSPYPSLRLWGVMGFETRSGKTEEWRPLVPKLIKMLNEPDAEWRERVVDRLWAYPEGKAALAEREQVETDPYVLRQMAHSGGNPQLYRDLLRLLASADVKVRAGALEFIASETGEKAIAAPMWRLRFDEAVYQKVKALTRSESAEEGNLARQAIAKMEEERRQK